MDTFLRLGDIKGEATDSEHKEWIIVDNVIFRIYRSIPQGAKDQQRTKGETKLEDVSVEIEMDKAAPKIWHACVTGTHIPDAEIHYCVPVNNKNTTFKKILLTNVLVTGYQTSASSSGNRLPSLQITLSFTKIELTYFKIHHDTGHMMGAVVGQYSPGLGKS